MATRSETEKAAGGGPAAGLGAPVGAQLHSKFITPPTSRQAVFQLARLLAGAGDANLDAIKTAWPDCPVNGGSTNPEAWRATLRAWLDARPELLRVVLAQDPNAPPQPSETALTVPPSTILELPPAARLTPALGRAASTVGGWLGQYVEYVSQVSPRTPTIFHEAAGLWAGGLAIARRLRLPLAHGDIWPNLYTLLVAPTTLYAKSTGVRALVNLIDKAVPQLLLSSEFTPEALLSELAGKEPAALLSEDEETRNLWTAGRNFAAQRGVILDEASALFAGFRRDYMTGTAEMLLRLYDGPSLYRRHTRGGGFTVVRCASLSFLGATTPASLRRADVAAGWYNGLFARFALLTPSAAPVYALTDTRPDPPPTLVTALQRLASELLPLSTFPDLPQVLDATMDREAFDGWQRYDKALIHDLLTSDDRPDGRLWGCYGRFPTKALKVALILAALDWAGGVQSEPRITVAHWAKGQLVAEEWRASAHRMLDVLAGGDDEREQEDRVMRVLRRAGDGGMTAREVGLMLHIKRQVIEPILDGLADDGQLETFTPPGGRAKRYRLPSAGRKA